MLLPFSKGRPLAAQTSGQTYRVGYLGFTATNTPYDDRVWNGFLQRLRELGFVEGRNLVLETRYAEGHNERYADFAAEYVRLKTDVIVAGTGTAIRAAMAASPSVLVVSIGTPDPVRAGFAKSLSRPGGQVTGISNLSDVLVPKQIELLKAAVPGARRIALAKCSGCLLKTGLSAQQVEAIEQDRTVAARSLGLELLQLDVSSADDFPTAIANLQRERPDGLIIGTNEISFPLRARWVAFAIEQRMPMMSFHRGYEAVLSYGVDGVAMYRLAAEYVAKLLHGADPRELPMEQPTKLEFVINLRVARQIGLTIPRSVLLRADDVIE